MERVGRIQGVVGRDRRPERAISMKEKLERIFGSWQGRLAIEEVWGKW
jgi:hypothetical protein